ncbi:MAG TPA: VWA domain-containing protein [Afifellaceae bacterium]|nr:VWA domain-containing protein [Afifellaceae bacterium]
MAAPGYMDRPIATRMAGFMAHLRLNHFAVGPGETQAALSLMQRLDLGDATQVRLSLKTLLAGRREEWQRFDELFQAYWLPRGRLRQRLQHVQGSGTAATRPRIWSDHLPPGAGEGPAVADRLSEDDADAAGQGRPAPAKVAGSRQELLARTDLRFIVDPEEIAEAEELAFRLAAAIRDRLSRRLRAAQTGPRLDLRRTIRASIAHGGDPIELIHRKRPERPVRLVVLLDVSGSMKPYSRFFLQFLRGLACRWIETDAYLFHTRLLRVTEALRAADPSAAMRRLSMLMEGFGGGTRIAASLATFNDSHARRALDSRTVVIVLSDGYDTDPPEPLAAALARLKRRARRIVWLNPLAGWAGYEPVARAMAAAMPHIDHFAAAHNLESLAALEPALARL